jgi:hypothetical protein
LSPPTTQGGSWTESLLYAFTGGSDGGYPLGSLTIDQAGNLYGVVTQNANIFKLSPSHGGSWTDTVLYTFSLDGNDGSRPNGGLLLSGGDLFGTTSYGGNDGCYIGCGTVYKLVPPAQPGNPWTEIILHTFQVTGNGHNPAAGVIAGKDGLLYGTTDTGGIGSCSASGTRGCGTVYSIIP